MTTVPSALVVSTLINTPSSSSRYNNGMHNVEAPIRMFVQWTSPSKFAPSVCCVHSNIATAAIMKGDSNPYLRTMDVYWWVADKNLFQVCLSFVLWPPLYRHYNNIVLWMSLSMAPWLFKVRSSFVLRPLIQVLKNAMEVSQAWLVGSYKNFFGIHIACLHN